MIFTANFVGGEELSYTVCMEVRSMSSSRNIALAVTLIVAVAGCAKGPQEKLTGKWVGESIDNIPPDQDARATGWVRATSLEFRGDKVTVAIPAEEPRTGAFKVERLSGNKMTLAVTRANGERDDATFVLTGENTMKWDIGNDRSIRLVRVAAR